MAEVFRRPRLAAELADRLLRPGVLDEGLRSGLFLSGLRRTGKTTFLRTDLVPELEAQGAVVIYVDLWSDTKASPASLPYPVLDQEYVRHVLERLHDEGMQPLPSTDAAWIAFQTLGHRPEEFLRALGQLRLIPSSQLAPDQLLPVIAATLRGSAADLELLKVEQIGGLATAIFDRVARSEGPARGIFSAEAAAGYGEAIGREVRVDDIQPVVNELLAANVLMRLGHGLYGVTDPFVQEIWRERQHR